jgi:exosortase
MELNIEHSTTRRTQMLMTLKKRHLLFAACCFVVVLVNMAILRRLLDFSLEHEFGSMIPFMPFLSVALILRKQKSIFVPAKNSLIFGVGLLLFGTSVLIWAAVANLRFLEGNVLSIRTAGILGLVLGAFLISYGWESFKKAILPLLMLLFMIPIPVAWLATAIQILQKGSAEGVAILLSLTGTPYHREGLSFLLPRTSIEIAPQCSSIRSSLALVISCLLAGHLVLRTTSRKLILVLVTVPMAMVKNAIRIVTLSLLAIHVDMGYLSGSDLHRRGGIVFFILTLLLMWPVLWILRKTEKNATDSAE